MIKIPFNELYPTSAAKDPLLCELLAEMESCSKEEPYGCLNCKVADRCAYFLDNRSGIGKGYFTPERLARCKEEFASIRASKNGNGQKGE